MSLLYAPAVLLAYLGNRNFTFRHEGRIPVSLARYFAAYAFGYVFYSVSHVVLVDMFLLPAEPASAP